MDNNQRGEIIENHLRNGDASYIANKTSTVGRPKYTLSAERAGTKQEMTCKKRGAFVSLHMVLDLPNLPDIH